MRFAVVDEAGLVLRRGDCAPIDFEKQATWPGETVVFPELDQFFQLHGLRWDFDDKSFVPIE